MRFRRMEKTTAMVAFLCLDETAHMASGTLIVDGGLTLFPDSRTV